MDRPRSNNISIVGGLLLVLLGVVFLAVTLGIGSLNWSTIWPVFLIMLGVVPVALAFTQSVPEQASSQDGRALPVAAGSFFILLGIFFFATTLGALSWGEQGTLWPLYIVAVGLALLAGYALSGLKRNGYLIGGLVLSVVGAGLLWATLSGFLYGFRWAVFEDVGRWFRDSFEWSWASTWWPLFPIVAGLILLAASLAARGSSARAALALAGTVPLLIGLFHLATTAGPLEWSDQGRLWPVYPLIVAVSILVAYFASRGEHKALLLAAAIPGAVGLLFLPATLINYSLFGQMWPLIIIAAGLVLLVPWIRGRGGMLGHR